MLKLSYTNRFEKGVRRAAFRGKDIMKLFPPVFLLLDGQTLPKQYSDHPLHGNWSGHREFHVEPDWLVIYRVENEAVLVLFAPAPIPNYSNDTASFLPVIT